MIPSSFAQMLSNTLYERRFFPYYAWNLLAIIDEKGEDHNSVCATPGWALILTPGDFARSWSGI